MGSFRSSKQGSAAFSHVHMRGSRLGVALGAALLLTLLAATPAFGAGVSVDAGAVLRYDPPATEDNNLTITQGAANDFTVSDSAALTAGVGCAPVPGDANSATCTGATTIRVNVSFGNDTVVINASVPSTIFGRDGNDNLTGGSGPDLIDGHTGNDTINVRGPGPDTVICASNDADVVTSDADDTVSAACRNDNGVDPVATITGGPSGPTNQSTVAFDFVVNETDVQLECSLEPVGTPEAPLPCAPGDPQGPLADGDYTFSVRANDDVSTGVWDTRAFTVDTQAPQVTVTAPGPDPINDSTPTFQLDAPDEPGVSFDCAIDAGAFESCGGNSSASFTTPALANGAHTVTVRGTDPAGNSTVAGPLDFVTEAAADPGGGGPPPPSSPAQPRRIIIESLVLISGRSVKMSRRGIVTINLNCAGTRHCTGRMTITTAEPVNRRARKLTRLGSKRFSIAANHKRNVKVRFSKTKRRLAKRLKRFKAKVVINEVDERGNPRISSRIFILRAR
jgi:Bacterial Ig-like domain/RTX calcium-binding nonapeptide repeat (4 copies)